MKYYFVYNGIKYHCDTKKIFVNALCIYLDSEGEYPEGLEAYVNGEEVAVNNFNGKRVISTASLGEIWRGLYVGHEEVFAEVEVE